MSSVIFLSNSLACLTGVTWLRLKCGWALLKNIKPAWCREQTVIFLTVIHEKYKSYVSLVFSKFFRYHKKCDGA